MLIPSKVKKGFEVKRRKGIKKVGAADSSEFCIFMPFRRSTSNPCNF